MKLAALSLALLVTSACKPDTSGLERKIDALGQRIEVLEARVGKGGPPQQQRARRPEPAPTDVFAVSIDGLPSVGPADAPITIVEGYEYACPACQNARNAVKETLAKYGEKVRVVYKPYIVHPDVAIDASVAVCAAHEQGKFAEMDAAIWEKAYPTRSLAADKLQALAAEVGLDMTKYAKATEECRQKVAQHHGELQAVGQGATPTFYINGRYVVGASPMKLHAVIDQELALADERIKAGTKPADYYKTWVIEKGQKRFTPKS